MYNPNSAESIINYAKRLRGQSLRSACEESIHKHNYQGKGNFGQLLENFYFGYSPNSDSAPDFAIAGLELKTSPLKKLKRSEEYRSKERLVLNIINYLEVHKETFEESSFWRKNQHLLLIFYLHNADHDILDYIIKLVDDWKYPDEDLEIIKRDWNIIQSKIKNGKAHELSEGDTFYLGACTKGATAASSLRDQPFNEIKAKQRAYSLKQGYVNHIISKISQNEANVYGKIIDTPRFKEVNLSIEEYIESKFKPFYNMSSDSIDSHFSLNLNKKAKNYFANLTNAILGIELGKRIEEFEKADIQVKTVRLKENNTPKESISFPNFKYTELIDTDWDDSNFKTILESKFFFVFYQFEGAKLILRKVKFWNMPYEDILMAKKVWDSMKESIISGKIIAEIKPNGSRLTHFPKKTDNKVSHVRPHAKDASDVYDLPVADKLTGVKEYTKHCFWLNDTYIRDDIYLKSL
jgi:DNA mismatch repair protein MutH